MHEVNLLPPVLGALSCAESVVRLLCIFRPSPAKPSRSRSLSALEGEQLPDRGQSSRQFKYLCLAPPSSRPLPCLSFGTPAHLNHRVLRHAAPSGRRRPHCWRRSAAAARTFKLEQRSFYSVQSRYGFAQERLCTCARACVKRSSPKQQLPCTLGLPRQLSWRAWDMPQPRLPPRLLSCWPTMQCCTSALWPSCSPGASPAAASCGTAHGSGGAASKSRLAAMAPLVAARQVGCCRAPERGAACIGF